MITIRNLTKRPIVLNLAHAHACSPTECTCGKQKVGVQEHNPETGDRVVRAVHQRIPASVTIFQKGAKDTVPGAPDKDGNPTRTMKALDVSDPLLDTVARLPEVAELLRTGAIKIEKVVEPTADASPAPTPTPPQTPTPTAEPARDEASPPQPNTITKTAKPSKE